MTGWPWAAAFILSSAVAQAGSGGANAPAPANKPKAAAEQRKAAPDPGAKTSPLDQIVELKDGAVLERLCRDVRLPSAGTLGEGNVVRQKTDETARQQAREDALDRVYAVWLAADRFRFADYEPQAGRLFINTTGGFHTMRGGLGLWSSDSEPIEVGVPTGVAQEIAQAKERGTLAMLMYVHLDADPEETDIADTLKGEPCATRPGTNSYQLRVNWLGGELVETKAKRTLARFATENGRRTPVVAQRLLGSTQLRIGAPEGAGDGAGGVLRAIEERRTALQQCYERHGNHAEGGVVLGLDLDKSGGLSRAGVDVASLDSDQLQSCLLGEVRGARFNLSGGSAQHVMVPLVWSRDEAN